MSNRYYALACVTVLMVSCSDTPAPIIKTSRPEISRRFMENSTEASQFYKDKEVQVTDTVNSIQTGGSLVMAGENSQPYIVSTWGDSVDKVSHIRPGDKITIQCSYVDAAMMSQCEIL